MRFRKYILLTVLAVSAIACQDKKDFEPTVTPANPGDEVQFGGTLDVNTVSRTIYDDEVGKGTDDNYFPIYWLRDDQVLIASPHATAGRQSAAYKVQADLFPKTGQPEDKWTKNKYAGNFSKVGEVGVQWGSTQPHTFYSIYPYRNANKVTLGTGFGTEDENHNKKAIFNVNLPEVQTCIVEGSGNSLKMKTADMYACFMYAKTPNMTPDVNNGIVDLRYTPISTAIRFTLKGHSADAIAIIDRIELVAPQPISGEFTIDLTNDKPVIKPGTNASNKVTVFARYENEAYLQLSNGNSVELNAFILLDSELADQGIDISDSWYLEVTLNDNTKFKKSLGVNATTGHNKTLVAGQIHRLPTLPDLVPGTWDNSNWMKNIPRNVYLSEISIPGSWSSLNSNYQKGMSLSDYDDPISEQYKKGCRAFHLDTRYMWPSSGHDASQVLLSVASGGQSTRKQGGKVLMNYDSKRLFSTLLTKITSNVKDNEYMVVLCTFALDSYQKAGTTWYKDVSDACAENDKVLTVMSFDSPYYDDKSGIKLDANTTVGDVLGKVIVIIGCDDDISTLKTQPYWPTSSPCLFTHMSLTRKEQDYTFKDEQGHDIKPKYNHDDLYYCTGASSGVNLNNTLAQVTYKKLLEDNDIGDDTSDGRGYAPAYQQRYDIGSNVLTWSNGNYKLEDNYLHDSWVLLGLGGYQTNNLSSATDLLDYHYEYCTSKMNTWIKGKLDIMKPNPTSSETNYYPIGINLLNRIDNDYIQTTVTTILQLNTKFHKDFDRSKVAFDPSKTKYN